jgi:LmbE family N-acetylglucosaminyl deacetylase
MLGFRPNFSSSATVLCLGAHCDDIEIGCSGALLELKLKYPELRFVWVTFSGDDVREAETRQAALRLLGSEPDCVVDVLKFRGSYFPYCAADIKDTFEVIKSSYAPELIFTHYLNDRHQDHRIIAELTWNTFRNHAILEYEIAKYEGDLAHPNVYVPLSVTSMEKKVETLMSCFQSQHTRSWFDRELFMGQMRIRGVECNAPDRYAEAFHMRKMVL